MNIRRLLVVTLFAVLTLVSRQAAAQFSSSLQGTVQDASGAVVPKALVTLTNTANGVAQNTISGANGDFRFVSLAPGPYQVLVVSKGFSTSKINVQLLTEQTMNLPVSLAISTTSQTIEVSSQAPVLDTAESRTQLTINQEQLDSLPLPGRNLLGLTTLAPGVTGLGVIGSGGNGQSNDNYGSETQVTASANGRSSVGNMFVVDGLDITSNVTPGVLNLVPNPDTIQEGSVQVNTFNVDYGRSSSIVQVMTTRSGADRYHFLLSDYYTANWLTARTEFQPKETTKFAPFHSNNISTTLSGPVPFLHQTYFFTGWEPLLSLTTTTSQQVYEDPAFTAWAQKQFPNSIGVKLLAQYPATNASTTGVSKKGSDLYPSTCGTAAAAFIPCDLPVFDTGVFNASNYRNALQYNIRGDKYYKKDRIYANYYRTGLDIGGPSVRVDMGTPQHYIVRSIQANETHTFSQNTLNEAAFGLLRMEGLINATGPFHVPVISVTGLGVGLGVSKAHEDYVQHHYVWHDALTHIYRSHDIKVGYEGFHGDNLTFFGPWNSQPNFSFQSVADFLNDKVYTETGVAYNLLTGQQAGLAGGSYQFTGNMTGLYGQDTWKVNKRLTLNYGIRWDDFGNPSPENGSIESNFFYGPGTTITQQVANGYVKQVPHAFNHAIMAWSPRVGVAWDLTGDSQWLLRGGFGLYHDWVTLGNVQNEFANPPSPVGVTFQSNTSGPQPLYNIGTSDVYPYGFAYPAIPTSGLNDHGGIVGLQSNIAGNDPNLKASNTLNYAVTLERGLGHNYSVAAGYTGSYSNNLFTDFAGHTTNAYYGVDINNFPGSLIQNHGNLIRLNQNFGSIRYTVNGPTSRYNAFIAEFKGRFSSRGSIDVSYTHSSSWDDAGSYPTVQSNTGNYSQYWSPSNWNAPNRLSSAISYELPYLRRGPNFLHILSNGWKPSAITILQSGNPFTVLQSNTYAQGGDYNADGTNSDLPNVPTFGYNIPTSRKAQLNGVFKVSDFPAPSVLPGEGNELWNRYSNPGYANTDFALLKNNRLWDKATLQLRLEVYNLFNRASLGGISATTTSSTFGKSTSQYNARFLQLGARLEF